jgi:tetratricopeptide (TPR) repeat protein
VKSQPAQPPRAPSSAFLDRPAGTWLAVVLLYAAGWLAYAYTFSVPLLLDDTFAIRDNPSLRQLWPLGPVLAPPSHVPTAGRPLLNLSFALNYAAGGTAVGGYHAVNLLLHLLAGLALFGVVRRTLRLPALRERFAAHASLLALACAALWLLHPLHTSAVTYLSQRAESLMGLCYLTTLYCFLRGASAENTITSTTASTLPRSTLWSSLAVLCCACGMATKEVMVTAPLLVLLYDRCFLAGSWRAALRTRWPVYAGLTATWALLAGLVLTSRLQDRDVGYGGAFTAWSYLVTESRVLLDYLKLALWPSPLVFDYGPAGLTPGAARAAVSFALLAGLLVASVAGLRRGRAWGFFGGWFFLILAPTSSIVPIKLQPMAESRLYLPLAGVVTLAVLALYLASRRRATLVAVTAATLALVCAALTFQRNTVYATAISLWSDTVAQRPGNARAHNNLANALLPFPDRWPEAVTHYETALRLQPDYAEVESNLASLLSELPGRLPDALPHHARAVQLTPASAAAHNNYGTALARTPGRQAEAVAHFETALRLDPAYAQAHGNLANVLRTLPGRAAEAIPHYEAALRLQPDNATTHNNLANALRETPDGLAAALTHYETALRLRPDFLEAHYNYGLALLQSPTRQPEARAQFEAVLKLRPGFEPAVAMLARLDAFEAGRKAP